MTTYLLLTLQVSLGPRAQTKPVRNEKRQSGSLQRTQQEARSGLIRRVASTGPEAWEEEDGLGDSVVPQAPGLPAVPAEVGPVLEHHECFCFRMPWKQEDLIKPKAEQVRGNSGREQDGGGVGVRGVHLSPRIH